MDGAIPLDLCVSGDPMVLLHPLDVIQYARSSYYYDKVYVLFADVPEKKMLGINVLMTGLYGSRCKKICLCGF